MIAMTHIKNYAKLGYSSSRILAETNNRLAGQNRGALTVSVFLGILNLRTGLMEYVDGLQMTWSGSLRGAGRSWTVRWCCCGILGEDK